MKMYKSIDDHIKSFPEKQQAMLMEIRETVKQLAPDAIETISYGIPTFKLNGKNLVHFAGYKTHLGFYPTAKGIDIFKEELKPYATGKGTLQFSWDQPLPLALIVKIVKFRIKEITSEKGGDE